MVMYIIYSCEFSGQVPEDFCLDEINDYLTELYYDRYFDKEENVLFCTDDENYAKKMFSEYQKKHVAYTVLHASTISGVFLSLHAIDNYVRRPTDGDPPCHVGDVDLFFANV